MVAVITKPGTAVSHTAVSHTAVSHTAISHTAVSHTAVSHTAVGHTDLLVCCMNHSILTSYHIMYHCRTLYTASYLKAAFCGGDIYLVEVEGGGRVEANDSDVVLVAP